MLLKVAEGITDDHLKEVYSDPYICRVGHDHRPAAPIVHHLVTYLSATINGNFAGAFMAIQQTSIELELHSLLKKTSISFSRDLGNLFIKWAFEYRKVLRVTAYVIEGLESAKNFCLKLGMKIEGFKRDVCVQNGIIKGVYIIGMTRKDWENL